MDTNTFDPDLATFPQLLRSAVVFGANAAGKTNLLRALQYMQNFVVRSAVTPASTPHEFTPFKFSDEYRNAPSTFEITFVQNGLRYEYGFSLDAERVSSEWLVEYVHSRGRELFNRQFNTNKNRYDWKFSSYFKGKRISWSEQTRKEALFLSTAVQLNSAQLLPIFEWFQKRLVVVVGIVSLNETLTLKLLREPDGKEKLLPFLREADFGIADFAVSREQLPSQGAVIGGRSIMIDRAPGALEPELIKVTFTHTWGDASEQANLEFEDESSGTQAFFKNAGAWLNVLAKGEVFLIDEIDTSLHPLLTRFLIQKFHSSKTNPKNAQIIFNSHNLSLLDHDLFRRDQIWFAEKGTDGASRLYPLSDFKPRTDESLGRRYIRGQYGALPIIGESLE